MSMKKADCSACSIVAYSNFLYDYPHIVFFLSFLLFGILPLAVLFQFPIQLDNNPEKGFDTRGTEYAGPRLAWAALQPSLLLGSRVVVDVSKNSSANVAVSASSVAPAARPKRSETTYDESFNEFDSYKFSNAKNFLPLLATKNIQRLKRQISATNFTSADEREKRSWAEDLLTSFSSVACYDQPIPAMNYLTQLLITVPSYEDMYSMEFLRELCSLQNDLADGLRRFQHLTPYRSIWHVANYFACLAPESRLNCTYLTPSDVSNVRKDIEVCTLHRKSIINCRRSCELYQSIVLEIQNADKIEECDASCKQLAGVPKHCVSQMMSDLFYRVLPKDLMTRPFHLNVFLPFYTFSSYRMQGYDVELDAYRNFEMRATKLSAASETYKLKGMLMDLKRDILFDAAISDSKFSLIAGVCVFLLIAFYSLSLWYSFVVLIQLSLSVISALCIYRIFNVEFPLLNLTVFVLLISIGSDGAFLLFSGFPSTEKLNSYTFRGCLRHTTTTMFLTQFSTVVPFFLNILSSVVAFRSFGLFAGLTLITNYALLISFMPAFLIIQYRYVNPWLVRRLPSSLWYCFPSFSLSASTSTVKELHLLEARQTSRISAVSDENAINKPSNPPLGIVISAKNDMTKFAQNKRQTSTIFERFCALVQSLLHDVLPMVLVQGRWIWIGSLTIVLAFSIVICITQLRLPQYNPLQLFIDSNVHEYYDNHAEKLFYFVSSKVALPLNVRLVWGIEPLTSSDHFNPLELSALSVSPEFRLNGARQLKELAEQLRNFRAASFVEHPHKFWPERYLDWSRRLACEEANSVCCNFDSAHYADIYLDYCMRVSTAQLQTQYNDTPIYHNITFELVGYTALLPTKLKYSHRYANLSDSFMHFDKTFHSDVKELPMWYTTEWYLMSTWFDLQRSIIMDCELSVLVSSLVVLLFSALILRWKSICAMITIPSVIITTTGTVVFLGWEIGVLEGVILVLVVGLSFDYTLHYGAAIAPNCCALHRIQLAVKKATLPVTMAAFSSVIAGSVMLFAQTHAFFQVAVFLVVCTLVSFIFATFFFLPLIYVFSSNSKKFRTSDEANNDNISKCAICNETNKRHKIINVDLPLTTYVKAGESPERGG